MGGKNTTTYIAIMMTGKEEHRAHMTVLFVGFTELPGVLAGRRCHPPAKLASWLTATSTWRKRYMLLSARHLPLAWQCTSREGVLSSDSYNTAVKISRISWA